MKKLYVERVTEGLQALNSHYGVGDVRNVRMWLDGRVTFEQHPFQMKPRTRKARVEENTLYALGHQRSIGKFGKGHKK